jgi:hypothetical protein
VLAPRFVECALQVLVVSTKLAVDNIGQADTSIRKVSVKSISCKERSVSSHIYSKRGGLTTWVRDMRFEQCTHNMFDNRCYKEERYCLEDLL